MEPPAVHRNQVHRTGCWGRVGWDRWIHEWRGIVERCAYSAIDLSNYPETRKTCMSVHINPEQYTGDKTPARSFKVQFC